MLNRKKKILLVEEEKFAALDILSTLNELGYKVTSTVDNEKDAVRKYVFEKPDLVLIDIELKRGAGSINTAKSILKKFKVPVVFLTVSPHEIFTKSTTMKSSFSFLTKPFNPLDLQAAIEMAFLNETFFVSN